MYSIWIGDTCFLADVPTARLAERLCAKLSEHFGVTAYYTQD